LFIKFQSWELMNTAVLTGRQVSQPMKVFMVSQGGEIADVTLHTSCHTSDDSALKVYQILIFGLFPPP
jgi:transmembrane protein 132